MCFFQAELRRAQVAAVELKKDSQFKKATAERKAKLVLIIDQPTPNVNYMLFYCNTNFQVVIKTWELKIVDSVL